MKFSTVLALSAASFAAAQLDVPSCALPCLLDAIQGSDCDEMLDFECQCGQPGLVDDAVPCVRSSCSPADQAEVSSIVDERCSEEGVPITLPPLGEPTATSAPEPTEEPTEEPTGEPTEEPTEAPTEEPSMPTSTPPVPTGSGTMPPGPAPTDDDSPPFDGAASNINANVAGVGAALLAVAAYL